jgi:hypothetical protein
MVSFVCSNCQQTLKKQKIASHGCHNCHFDCLDCAVEFNYDTYQAHSSCITEVQKFQKHLVKPAKPAQKPVVSHVVAPKIVHAEPIKATTVKTSDFSDCIRKVIKKNKSITLKKLLHKAQKKFMKTNGSAPVDYDTVIITNGSFSSK